MISSLKKIEIVFSCKEKLSNLILPTGIFFQEDSWARILTLNKKNKLKKIISFIQMGKELSRSREVLKNILMILGKCDH